MRNDTRTFLTLIALGLAAGSIGAQAASGLKFNGDFRVRYEYTTEGNSAASFGREVGRFRLGMTYALRDDIVVRARLATGDPGDPNSADVTLGSFVNDLAVSLDIASVEANRSRWAAFAGKFANPFQSTELVWDGDVNPQGVAGRVMVGEQGGGSVTGTLTGLFFTIDPRTGNQSSNMGGAQVTISSPTRGPWKLAGSAAYYDYRIGSLAGADAGDTRSNRLVPGDSAYVSDFNLLDLMVVADYTGFAERYPLRVVGDYVHNSGATDLNTGWEADVYFGRGARQGDLRFRYGYGMTEADAVLAAFSHDNTTLGTNYEIHTLSVDAVPIASLFLNATLYYYRPHQAALGRKYQSRLRLNAMVTF